MGTTRRLVLEWSGPNLPQLQGLHFSHPLLDHDRYSVRGKSTGATLATGSFQWTAAVQAVALLLMRGLGCTLAGRARCSPCLIGGPGSPAASLDFAIDKEPAWMSEMFGCDAQGGNLLKRLVLRSNPHQKRSETVSVALRPETLVHLKITASRDGSPLNSIDQVLALIASLEKNWRPQRLSRRAAGSRSPISVGRRIAAVPDLIRPENPPPHYCPWPSFPSALRKEIIACLAHSHFSARESLAQAVSIVRSHHLFLDAAQEGAALLEYIPKELPPSIRLGVAGGEQVVLDTLRQQAPLTVALAGFPSANAALWYYLALVRRLPFQILDYFSHAWELTHALLQGNMAQPPDLLCLPMPAAGLVLRQHQDLNYVPLLPGAYNRQALLTRSPIDPRQGLKHTRLILHGDHLSSQHWLYQQLTETGELSADPENLYHLDPDQAYQALTESSDISTICFFPHSFFYSESCGFTPYPDLPQGAEWIPHLILARRALLESAPASYALRALIGEAWTKLVNGGPDLDTVVEYLSDSSGAYFQRFLTVSGIFPVSRPKAACG